MASLAPVCFFYRARGGGINAVRSRSHPCGLRTLTGESRRKVKEGNSLLQIAVEFFELCHTREIPWIWENPLTSWMWEHPLALKIGKLAGVTDHTAHYCAFGARWFKPTRFRVFGLRTPERLERTCCRNIVDGRWLCQHSGQAHIVLQGRDEQGVNWTARASAYPRPLAELLAEIMSDTAFADALSLQLRIFRQPRHFQESQV